MAYLGNSLTVQQYAPQIAYFNGNGSTTAFTLPIAVVSAAQIIVSIENVIQNPSTAFSVSGTTLTFTSAPPSGTNNIWVEYTSLQSSVNALPANPSIVGDLLTSGGQYSVGAFNSAYTDGLVQDYVTGNGRFTVGGGDGFTWYNGGPSARNALMTMDSSGNVGIGTSSPSFPLQVQKSGDSRIAIVSTSGSNTAVTQFSTNNGSSYWYNYYNGSSFVFQDNANERMRIDSSGNLLVGTTTQFGSAKLSVNGSIASGTGWYTRAGASGSLGSNLFNIQWTGNPYLWIDSTNIGQLATVSDYRLKENVTPQTTALNRVMQLQPVKFNRKAVGIFGGSSDIEEGFLAHELQAIIPSAVTGDKDALTEDGTIQPQSLNWSPVVSVLVKAIQELNAKVTALEAKLESK